MSRYIDADALKKRVSELIVPDWTRTLIRSWLDSEPTVDAVPVVHGEWIYKNRHRKSYRRYTGVDDFGETHTITVLHETEGREKPGGSPSSQDEALSRYSVSGELPR